MADERYRQDYPQQGRPDSHPTSQHHHSGESYSSGEPSRASMATMTLPPIQDPRGSYPQPPPGHAPPRGYPADPRYPSPHAAANGYPPPPGSQAPMGQPPPGQQPQGYLPPLPSHGDSRSPTYPPPPDQRAYYDQRSPHYEYPPPPPEAYYYRGPPPPPNGYPRDYRVPPGHFEYAPGHPGGAPMAQAAPRQRTSIACRYCRKRKIRCSGYQSAPGGKCQNCARMNQECIFQPVSSSSSTAFIPVSAVPGGVPPGTQLFGAYGEPLPQHSYPGPPSGHAQMPPQPGPPGHYHHYPPPPGHGPPGMPPQQPPPGPYYQQPMHSPTESFSSHGDPRMEEKGQMAGTRRRRTPEEQEEGYRLPPPRAGAQEEDPRRRSPAEASNHSSPNALPHHPHPGARQSPSQSAQQPPLSTSHPGSAAGGRSPAMQGGSSGASTPAKGSAAQAGQGQPTGVMSLSNLVDKSDIDKTMIERLNQPRR